MSPNNPIGLTRRELERRARWTLRTLDSARAPEDPAELPRFIADLIVDLIDANNTAIAQALDTPPADLPDDL